jgi:hypothetical protein
MSPLPSSGVTELNDAFRIALTRATVTRGVAALPLAARNEIISLVRGFGAFDDDNDPYGEHDFGAVEHAGVRYFWKIDYYDLQLRGASPDPADPTVTRRVMTIMRADEY